MNTPTSTPAPDPDGLPEPDYDSPMVTLVVSNPVFPRDPKPSQSQQASCPHCKGAITLPVPDKTDKDDPRPVFWLLSKPHPFVPNITIRRMHVEDGVVSIFSTSDDRQTCIIDEIPEAEEVRVYGYSQIVIHNMRRLKIPKGLWAPYMKQAHALAMKLRDTCYVRYEWIPRIQNSHADKLADYRTQNAPMNAEYVACGECEL